MSLPVHSGGQKDSEVAAEPLSSTDLSGVSLNNFSSMKQPEACPAGREVVFVCTYGPISL